MMKNILLFVLLFMATLVWGQNIKMLPYRYSSIQNLPNQTLLVTGASLQKSYLEVYDYYGNKKASYTNDLIFLAATTTTTIVGNTIYHLWSDRNIGYFITYDFSLNPLDSFLMDTSFDFYSTSSQHLIRNNHIYMIQPKKANGLFYFNQYSMQGKLQKSFLMDSSNSILYDFNTEPSIQFINENKILILNYFPGREWVYMDTLGNWEYSTNKHQNTYNKYALFYQNYLYEIIQPKPNAEITLTKMDSVEKQVNQLSFQTPVNTWSFGWWLGTGHTFIPLNNDQFLYYTALYEDYYPKSSIALFQLDLKTQTTTLLRYTKDNSTHPGLVMLSTGDYMHFYCKGEGTTNFTYVEFLSNNNNCTGKNIPNPSTGYFEVISECFLYETSAHLVMADEIGRIITEFDIPMTGDGVCKINANVAQGLYYCQLTAGGKQFGFKQVIVGAD